MDNSLAIISPFVTAGSVAQTVRFPTLYRPWLGVSEMEINIHTGDNADTLTVSQGRCERPFLKRH
jgi:hypothetical protein